MDSTKKEKRIITKKFALGDLVWAKMKSYPYWPGRIEKPPETSKVTTKKGQHFVYFYESENFAWISDEFIQPHSEKMLATCNKPKIMKSLKNAAKLIEEDSKKRPAKTVPSDNEDAASSDSHDTFSFEFQPETSTPFEKKKVKKYVSKKAQRQNLTGLSPTKMKGSEDRVAVIRPFGEGASTSSSSILHRGSTKRGASTSSAFCAPSRLLESVRIDLNTKPVKPTQKKIGFLGLGTMGKHIVRNLLKSGHDVIVWNRTIEKCEELREVGASVGLSPAVVVEASDITFCCVSGTDSSKEIVFGKKGVLVGLENTEQKGKGYVEMSSLDPTVSQEIGEAIVRKGGRYLEAPMIGTYSLAAEGQLLVVVSGDRELFMDCETCFHAIAKDAYYVSSDIGSSMKYTMILNMLNGTAHTALAEALVLVDRLSLPSVDFFNILQDTGMPSMMVEKGRAMNAGDFTAQKPLKHTKSEMLLSTAIANKADQPLEVASASLEQLSHAQLLGYNENDTSAVYMGVKF